MSTAAQVETEWSALNVPEGGDAALPARVPGRDGGGNVDRNVAGTGAYPTDEEILGMDSGNAPPSRVIPSGARNLSERFDGGGEQSKRDSSSPSAPRNDTPSPESGYGVQARSDPRGAAAMPEWMQAIAGDPKVGPGVQEQAQQLWREHQEFRAAFASPEEARAIKECFPGGVQEARSLRQAAQAVDQIDAAIYSGDVRAQSEVVAELARANPAAFRSLFAEAAKVLAGLGQSPVVARENPTLRENREGWGTRQDRTTTQTNFPGSEDPGYSNTASRQPLFHRDKQAAGATSSPVQMSPGNSTRNDNSANPDAATANQHGVIPNEVRNPSAGFDARNQAASLDTNHPSAPLRASESQITNHAFDPAAYAAFERSTNDAVARDVRTTVMDTIARVLPEGVGEGAARRIGDDIFNEIHRTLAADRTLSEQVGEVLRASLSSGQGWRFGANEQARVAQLLSGRARQLVPSVARKVIGEWTTSVLGTARNKAARQAAAASRVDIAAPGGSLDSMPLRPMSPREVNYASMSDDEILGM